MPIKKLSNTDIKELIRMIPIVDDKAKKTIAQVLDRIYQNKINKVPYTITPTDDEYIKKWCEPPNATDKEEGYKAAKSFAYVVGKWLDIC